ncbi:YcaO-like family protein [Yimella sp. cx-573]|nr:YcaO-like family protein [Yimella sp. cx-573]
MTENSISARRPRLKVRHYNREVPWLPATSSGAEQAGIEEMLNVYSPFGEIRTVMTALRPGLACDGYQGSATPMSLDHIFRRMVGLPGLNTGLDRDIYGGGKGLNISDSVLSSLGEAIERMLGSFSCITAGTQESQWYGSSRELEQLGRPHVRPEDYPMFAEQQLQTDGFLCEPWDADSRMYWIQGENLLTGQDWWVPAQLVHLFYFREQGEARIGVSSSGGLATHLNDERALSHGLLEVIERDAANLSWFTRVLPRKVELDQPFRSAALNRWMESAQRSGIDVSFYVHRTDVPDVSVVTAISVEHGMDENSYLAGGGVGLNVEEAIRSAIAELIQSERMVRTPEIAPSWRVVQGFQRLFGINRDATADDFTNFIQVVPYYGYAENQERLDWYLRSESSPPSNSVIFRWPSSPTTQPNSKAC